MFAPSYDFNITDLKHFYFKYILDILKHFISDNGASSLRNLQVLF